MSKTAELNNYSQYGQSRVVINQVFYGSVEAISSITKESEVYEWIDAPVTQDLH